MYPTREEEAMLVTIFEEKFHYVLNCLQTQCILHAASESCHAHEVQFYSPSGSQQDFFVIFLQYHEENERLSHKQFSLGGNKLLCVLFLEVLQAESVVHCTTSMLYAKGNRLRASATRQSWSTSSSLSLSTWVPL